MTVFSSIDSLYSEEPHNIEGRLDSFGYVQKATKADCPKEKEEVDYYYKNGFLSERDLYCLPDRKAFYKTLFTSDEKGRELTSRSYLDTVQGDYNQYKYNKKGLLVESILNFTFYDYTDTVHYKYDKKNRLKTKAGISILGSKQWEKTAYSKDGSLSVRQVCSEYSPKHGSLLDSTYYTASGKIAKVLQAERDLDNMSVMAYQYDDAGRVHTLMSYMSNEPKSIGDKYVFSYHSNGLLEKIEHYTRQYKATLIYQYAY